MDPALLWAAEGEYGEIPAMEGVASERIGIWLLAWALTWSISTPGTLKGMKDTPVLGRFLDLMTVLSGESALPLAVTTWLEVMPDLVRYSWWYLMTSSLELA